MKYKNINIQEICDFWPISVEFIS